VLSATTGNLKQGASPNFIDSLFGSNQTPQLTQSQLVSVYLNWFLDFFESSSYSWNDLASFTQPTHPAKSDEASKGG
jgi:hypothetical protein